MNSSVKVCALSAPLARWQPILATDRGSLAWAVTQTIGLLKPFAHGHARQRKPARQGQRAMGGVAKGVHDESSKVVA
jgi:hypothetical protein